MKFHCDRCSTKYSISDERVRGKILKIRCKNCSDVITVRDPAKAASSKAVKKKQPQKGKASQHSSEPKAKAPESFEAEWYVSEDGDQEGPFTLNAAIDWVRSKSVGADLFCWSDGFDDWLPVDKVSHFRGIRPEVPFAPPSEVVPTPKPLFAATMAALGEESGNPMENLPSSFSEVVAGHTPPVRTPTPPPVPVEPAEAAAHEGGSLDFDIGEASRIVDVSALLAGGMARNVNPAGKPIAGAAGLSGTAPAISGTGSHPMGLGTGSEAAVTGEGNDTGAAPILIPPTRERKKRAGLLIPLLFGGFAIALVAGILIYMFMDDSSGNKRITRGSVGGSNTLGYSNTSGPQGKRIGATQSTVDIADPVNTGKGSNKPIRKRQVEVKPIKPIVKNIPRDNGEVDLSGSSSKGPTGPLGGDDLMRTYRKNQIALKMCYERSLKKNPLLKVPKTWVDVKVGLSGKVTSVKINSLAGTPLGQCLVGRIKRWKFRTTTEVFDGRFRVVFDR